MDETPRKKPSKSNSVRRMAMRVIIVCLAGIMLVSGWRVYTIIKGYLADRAVYDKISEEAGDDIDFDALRKINPDVIGWLYYEDTIIDYPVVQGENFTSILSSKDLCMIDHLKELEDAGVDSIKIEGRMKSIYYTAVITRAYRKQLDYIEGISSEDPKPYVDEIFKVSHREFSTGFYYGKDEIEMPTFKSYMSEAQFLGSIEEQVAEGLYRLDVKNQILSSDSIEYIGPDLLYLKDEGFTLLDEDMQSVPKTDHGKIAYIKTDKKLKKGYIIRKKD